MSINNLNLLLFPCQTEDVLCSAFNVDAWAEFHLINDEKTLIVLRHKQAASKCVYELFATSNGLSPWSCLQILRRRGIYSFEYRSASRNAQKLAARNKLKTE